LVEVAPGVLAAAAKGGASECDYRGALPEV